MPAALPVVLALSPSGRCFGLLLSLLAASGAVVGLLWRRRISAVAAVQDPAQEGRTRQGASATSAAETTPAQTAEVMAPFPLGELPRDVHIASLAVLGAKDLARASTASRLGLLLAREVQRRPSLVVEVGTPEEVLAALGRRLAATPTIGFVFGTGDLAKSSFAKVLTERLPAGCQVVGAATQELQALVPATAGGSLAAAPTKLHHVSEPGQVTLMLGSFPDAIAQAFHITADRCLQISEAGGSGLDLKMLARQGLPTGAEWKTVVLLPCDMRGINAEGVVKAFQQSCPNAAIIGGIAGSQLILHRLGKTRFERTGVVGLALKGEVPLTGLVSRGCAPLMPAMQARSAEIVDVGSTEEVGFGVEQYIVIPELISGDGSTKSPIEVAMKCQQRSNRMPVFSGVRLGEGSGYLLEGLSQASFERPNGAMSVPCPSGAGTGAPGEASPAVKSCEVCFFKLDADACKADLRKLLGYLRTQCEESEEEVLGSVMFTCGGRNEMLFGEGYVDARYFQEAFPKVPMVGFWAGGEIGPQALAEATPSEATRTGRASIQGFTAVFGVFRAPRPSACSLLASLGDEEVPEKVGEVMAHLSHEAKERGNAAFRDTDHTNALKHYTRAVELATVPSAQVSKVERATLFANRALAGLKEQSNDSALLDAVAAIELDSSNAKAHYRRAQALLSLKRPSEAIAGLRVAMEHCPAEASLAELLAKVEKGVESLEQHQQRQRTAVE
mmetsp:Transcript_91780/g.205024  ORF Transcript_91780/g.205024 Transcript_91780/m.205024 type:complete len:729 (-) Transcript_91780:66-2252(-)